jgi:hypothetical protein
LSGTSRPIREQSINSYICGSSMMMPTVERIGQVSQRTKISSRASHRNSAPCL